MKLNRRRQWAVATLCAGAALGGVVHFTVAAGPAPAGPDMADTANAFLATLDPKLRKQAQFSFEDKDRDGWHYIPGDRVGVRYKDLRPPQREAAHKLLRAGLSASGLKKAQSIMQLESVLAEMEKDPEKRDPEKYWFAVFGKPERTGTWSWSFEGHHVSLNFTVVRGTLIATSPSFLGANPAEVREGKAKGTRVLAAEEDLGRTLVKSVSEAERKKVVFNSAAPPEILTGAEARVGALEDTGLAVAAMNEAQRKMVRHLLESYAALMAPELATERMARVEEAGFDKIRFAWAGGLERGDGHYYRLQGPTFLVEYDNTQNDANHIHTVWRDFKGDFGRDLLAEHYKTGHK